MKFFLPINKEGYELVQPLDAKDFETINTTINGRLQMGNYKEIQMTLLTKDERGKPRIPSDAPWLGDHALILKPTAVKEMDFFLFKDCELFPLGCEGAQLMIVNPIHLVDALDEERSTVRRLAPQGRIWRIDKYEFHPERIQGLHIFKISNLRVSSVYVSDAFVARWKEAGLKGMEFNPVWEGAS